MERSTSRGGIVLGSNLATVGFDNGPRYSQPHAEAVRFGGKERLENAADLVSRNPRPTIGHRNLDAVIGRLLRTQRYDSFSIGLAFQSIHSVDDQVEKHLLQMNAIAADFRKF